MAKRKTNHKMYLGIIAVMVVIIVVLSVVMIVQNAGKQQAPTQIELPSTESNLKTTSEAKAASDETLTSISEIKTLLDGVNDALTEK